MDYLHPPTVPRLEEQDLRQFVLGVADGQVFTSAHFRGNDFEQVGLVVFMPLIGGLQPEEGVHVPKRPVCPEPPKPKPHIEYPPEPEPEGKPNPPELREASDKRITELEFRIRWGRVGDTAVDDYLAGIAEENEAAIAEFDRKMEAHQSEQSVHYDSWKVDCTAVDAQNAAIDAENAVAHAKWEVENAKVIEQQQEWEDLCDRWRKEFTQQIGVLWEWMSKAGPRAINGYPTFFSVRLLHRDDWERARKAIIREQKRREDIEV
jgi:hypothetical protein